MTVYLDPGEYTITETKDPLNTELSKIDEQESIVESKAVSVTAGTETTVRFYNRETLGDLKIVKEGKQNGRTAPLAGVEFTLYGDEECTKAIEGGVQTTNNSGIVEFTGLPAGPYWVKETSTPTGYLPETEAQKVEVTANTTNELKFPTNIHNTAYVKLQKQYRNYKEGYVNVDSSNYKTFQNAFTLQKKVGDGDWEAATNINGQPIIITLSLIHI